MLPWKTAAFSNGTLFAWRVQEPPKNAAYIDSLFTNKTVGIMVVFSSVAVQQFPVLEGQVLFLLRHLVQLNWGSFIDYYFTLSTIILLFEYRECWILLFTPQLDRWLYDLRFLGSMTKWCDERRGKKKTLVREHRSFVIVTSSFIWEKARLNWIMSRWNKKCCCDIKGVKDFKTCCMPGTAHSGLWPPFLFSFPVRSHPSVLQASAWRSQPPKLIPAAGAAAKVLPRTWRGWATRPRSP